MTPPVTSHSTEKSAKAGHNDNKNKHQHKNQAKVQKPKVENNAAMGNAFADAFAKLKK